MKDDAELKLQQTLEQLNQEKSSKGIVEARLHEAEEQLAAAREHAESNIYY